MPGSDRTKGIWGMQIDRIKKNAAAAARMFLCDVLGRIYRVVVCTGQTLEQ